MKPLRFCILWLLIWQPCCKAEQISKEQKTEQETLQGSQKIKIFSSDFFGLTIDVILWEGIEYMCSGSPLSQFEDYTTVFGALTADRYTSDSPVDLDKNYIAKWIIKDSYLYLYDVEILDGADKFPEKRENLKKLTNRTFQKDLILFPEYPQGVMLASWFSDTLYLKRKPKPGESYCDCMYRCESFKKLVFKDGVLIRGFIQRDVEISVDSVEIYTNPLKYRVNRFRNERLDPCTKHLKENLADDQYLLGYFFAYSSDEIVWNDTEFMCDESPLVFFENYKAIFPTVPFIEVETSLAQFHEKNYLPKWAIVNERLYLYDIDFMGRKDKYTDFEIEKKINEIYDQAYSTRFQVVEELTERKFQQVSSLKKEALFADWFSGTMYLKRYPKSGERMWSCECQCEAFHKIVFKNGRIITKEKTNYMVGTRDYFFGSLKADSASLP